MQKGQCFSAVLWAPPLSEPKMLQIFTEGTFAQKKRFCFVLFFCGISRFYCIVLYLKQKYHSAGTGSMLRGVQRYDNEPDFLVYTLLKTK